MNLKTIFYWPLTLAIPTLVLSACAPTSEEILHPFFSGHVELVTSNPGVQNGPKSVQTSKPIVFRWQPRSHQSLTTMPTAFVISLPVKNQVPTVMPAKVEQAGAFLTITVSPAHVWKNVGNEVYLGVALGLGNVNSAKELLNTTPISHQTSQGALMHCDPMLEGWRLCWINGVNLLID